MLRMVLVALCAAAACLAPEGAAASQDAARQLKVFLDCQHCYSEYLRSEIEFIDYVRDRSEADVHVLITSSETGSGGREYTVALIGLASFNTVNHTLKTVTTRSEPEDIIRRQIATTLRIGLLNYIARGGVPQRLDVQVELGSEQQRPAVTGDRWRNWVFSLRGSASMEGEESNRETRAAGSVSADRITPEWKMTIGAQIEHETEQFDLDEDDPVKVERRQRDLRALIVKSLGEHWSAGAQGLVQSSTFTNTRLSTTLAPAVEFNVFPYSAYTRRQLRMLYALGHKWFEYNEETLFGKTEESLFGHSLSVTFEQRERWGTIEARVEGSQYLHDLSKYRLEVDGELSWRIVRGLSVSADASASRIRDQLSLPRRGATSEEVLLRQRQLQSGYDYDFSLSLTYTFGSIFSSIVNPRFGS